MGTKILDFHIIVIALFILFFLYKTLLLVLNKKKSLRITRKKTKAIDIALGILIFATGFYLLSILETTPTYLIIKVVLVFIAIPLGIIGLRRESKIITLLTLLIFIYIYSIADTKSLNFVWKKHATITELNLEELERSTAENIIDANYSATIQQGKVIYKVLCVECHGEDGKESLPKAANLTESKLSMDEKVEIIRYGKGTMHGYDSELSEQEITLVAAFTETLK